MVSMRSGKGLMKKENAFIRALSLMVTLRQSICLHLVAVLARRRKMRVTGYNADRFG